MLVIFFSRPSLSFHCHIIYYEAQTYFILASILIPAQNIFLLLSFSFFLFSMFCIWFMLFYTRAILPFMYLTRVKVQTFKLWKKVSSYDSEMDWRSFHFISNGFLVYSPPSSLLQLPLFSHSPVHIHLLPLCPQFSIYSVQSHSWLHFVVSNSMDKINGGKGWKIFWDIF